MHEGPFGVGTIEWAFYVSPLEKEVEDGSMEVL
jgi:hypothetical protein